MRTTHPPIVARFFYCARASGHTGFGTSSSRTGCPSPAALVRAACVLIALAATAIAQAPQQPSGPRPAILTTRFILAHGRYDEMRSLGILTHENPGGGIVHGVTPQNPFPGAPPPPPGFQSPALARSVLDLIASAPDPLNVSLDLDRDGRADPPAINPLVQDGALINSGFTLLVRERMPNEAGAVAWTAPSPRFGRGNIYATVSIPAAGIVRGQELYTDDHITQYTANSVIYEAPDVGTVINDNQLDGGTVRVFAQIGRERPSTLLGFADPLQTEIVQIGQTPLPDGRTRVRLQAVSDNSMEAPAECWYRWAIEAQSGVLITDVVGTNVLTFDLPFNVKPEDLPLKKWDEGLVNLTVAQSGWGRGVPAAWNRPFVHPLPNTQNSRLLDVVELYTFVSRSSTLSDTEAIQVRGGIDEDDSSAPGGPGPGGGRGAIQQSIVILLDASGSMKDGGKMDQAKASAARVLQRLSPATEVALIVFYDCSSIVVEHEFTTDASELLAILPRVQPSNGTPLAAATIFAKDYMRKNASGQTLDLIILSDGEESCSGDPIAAARH